MDTSSIEGRRHKRRTNNAILSQANKGFGNLPPGFFVFKKRLRVTLTAAGAPRTKSHLRVHQPSNPRDIRLSEKVGRAVINEKSCLNSHIRVFGCFEGANLQKYDRVED